MEGSYSHCVEILQDPKRRPDFVSDEDVSLIQEILRPYCSLLDSKVGILPEPLVSFEEAVDYVQQLSTPVAKIAAALHANKATFTTWITKRKDGASLRPKLSTDPRERAHHPLNRLLTILNLPTTARSCPPRRAETCSNAEQPKENADPNTRRHAQRENGKRNSRQNSSDENAEAPQPHSGPEDACAHEELPTPLKESKVYAQLEGLLHVERGISSRLRQENAELKHKLLLLEVQRKLKQEPPASPDSMPTAPPISVPRNIPTANAEPLPKSPQLSTSQAPSAARYRFQHPSTRQPPPYSQPSSSAPWSDSTLAAIKRLVHELYVPNTSADDILAQIFLRLPQLDRERWREAILQAVLVHTNTPEAEANSHAHATNNTETPKSARKVSRKVRKKAKLDPAAGNEKLDPAFDGEELRGETDADNMGDTNIDSLRKQLSGMSVSALKVKASEAGVCWRKHAHCRKSLARAIAHAAETGEREEMGNVGSQEKKNEETKQEFESIPNWKLQGVDFEGFRRHSEQKGVCNSPFKLLGLSRHSTTKRNVSMAYKQLMRVVHPDKASHPMSEALTKKVGDAYEQCTAFFDQRDDALNFIQWWGDRQKGYKKTKLPNFMGFKHPWVTASCCRGPATSSVRLCVDCIYPLAATQVHIVVRGVNPIHAFCRKRWEFDELWERVFPVCGSVAVPGPKSLDTPFQVSYLVNLRYRPPFGHTEGESEIVSVRITKTWLQNEPKVDCWKVPNSM